MPPHAPRQDLGRTSKQMERLSIIATKIEIPFCRSEYFCLLNVDINYKTCIVIIVALKKS